MDINSFSDTLYYHSSHPDLRIFLNFFVPIADSAAVNLNDIQTFLAKYVSTHIINGKLIFIKKPRNLAF